MVYGYGSGTLGPPSTSLSIRGITARQKYKKRRKENRDIEIEVGKKRKTNRETRRETSPEDNHTIGFLVINFYL